MSMNRAPIVLAIALIVAAIVPGRAETKANAVQTQTQVEMQTVQPAESGRTDGLMDGFVYTLSFVQPDGLSDRLSSAQAYPNQWEGAVVDRTSTVHALEQAGLWDSVPDATQITLSVPGKDIERVEVIFDPNTVYDQSKGLPLTSAQTYAPQSVSMMPAEDGQLHTCSFPVSFVAPDGTQDYHQLFCVIRVTFRDGDSCDIACALARKI